MTAPTICQRRERRRKKLGMGRWGRGRQDQRPTCSFAQPVYARQVILAQMLEGVPSSARQQNGGKGHHLLMQSLSHRRAPFLGKAQRLGRIKALG